MFSRAQCYLLTVVRCSGLLLLIVVIGNRVQKMMLPSWAEMTIGAIIIVLATMVGHRWAIKYETYLKDRERERGHR
jgi:hypothetical protein